MTVSLATPEPYVTTAMSRHPTPQHHRRLFPAADGAGAPSGVTGPAPVIADGYHG
jgi:hypothetical protein